MASAHLVTSAFCGRSPSECPCAQSQQECQSSVFDSMSGDGKIFESECSHKVAALLKRIPLQSSPKTVSVFFSKETDHSWP